MDFFGLAVHLASGMAGGQIAGRFLRGAESHWERMLAGAVGGLLGGQIIERSMALTSVPLEGAKLDLGAAIAGGGGACMGGAALAALIALFARCLNRG